MPAMSKDQNPNHVAPVGGPEAKTPLDRARAVQELQRAAEAAGVQASAPVARGSEAQPSVGSGVPHSSGNFDVTRSAPSALTAARPTGADAVAYGASQVDDASLFGNRSGAELQVRGNPWKVIPFGPPQQLAVLDTKKPIETFELHVPPQAVKHKEGNLFQITATPKAAGEAPIKRAVLTDDKGAVRGLEVKNEKHLARALAEIPSFALSLFRTVFGDGVMQDEPERHHRVVSVAKGKGSAYQVQIERKNTLDGKWKAETVPLNNFGLRVPEANDPRRHDIVVAMYYLDRFQAA